MSEPVSHGAPAESGRVLRKHRLRHLPELRLDDSLFQTRFSSACSMMNCSGNCCRYGVYADIAERDKILANAGMIIPHMDPGQEKNPGAWFETEIIDDSDFPSGRSIGTSAMPYGCVFLNGAGRCTLQITAVANGLPQDYLKPFFCFAYPIVISEGVLMLDDEEFLNRPECCKALEGGTKTVFELCEEELTFVLGDEGAKELRKIVAEKKI